MKLRRELKELLPHLAEMSGNEVKLCVLLHLNGGCLEESPDDLAPQFDWSLSTLKRTTRELKAKSYIEVERPEVKSEPIVIPAQVKSDPRAKSDPSKVSQGVKSDPEQVPDVPPGVNNDQRIAGPTKGFEVPESCRFTDELSAASRDLLEFIGFQCDHRFLSRGFVVLLEKYGKIRPWPRPGVLASKLITRCLHWQRKRKAQGADPRLSAWPAVSNFQKHTANLRRQERLAGKAEGARAAA